MAGAVAVFLCFASSCFFVVSSTLREGGGGGRTEAMNMDGTVTGTVSKNEIYEKCYSKIASILSYWFFTSNTDKEEFDRIIGEIDGKVEEE